ncbi:carbohydrate ABC transporter permease [Ornithinimicrobium cerasi]|uniref:Carbohydrate ABC transporter membrane protein 1, CUT1 family n=1 Tax=Ornithinimicrobium cerasi TaxID=2248773 RepID=A0A285VT13_9MICO|nr:sugar ABC transporter permease [Ornithinimicrobium cerasi]SOC57017.1 carbohydrate ABC transporter membrane protein 1, CUT1 family [Ornithinimicrobium cerasi]
MAAPTATPPGQDEGVVTPPRSRFSRAPGARREERAGWILTLPFLLLFLVFTAWPVIQSVFFSFTDIRNRDLRNPFAVDFVGLEQYTKAFADPIFRQAALNTAYFVVVGVPLTMTVALAAAVALNSGISRFRAIFRLGFYTPVITSIIAVAVVWRFLLHPDSGLVNTALAWIGIDGPNWLGSTTWAMPSLIAMATWRNFGTAMIIFLAGLQSVPVSLHEAAAIDGANAWQRFVNVTLPILRPTILFVSVTTAIGYLQFFEEPFVMTKGGPLNSTISASMFTYQQFSFGNYGYAAAISYLIFIVIVIVTAIQFRFLADRDER